MPRPQLDQPIARTRTARATIRLAHSPDPDDAFMWWPLFSIDGRPPRLDTGRFAFEQVTTDIETLNQRALKAVEQASVPAPSGGDGRHGNPPPPQLPPDLLEITALSCATYPRVKSAYALTACGASMGDSYGPKIVARTKLSLADLKKPDVVIAIPGEGTTAFAAASLLLGPPYKSAFKHKTIPFKQIIEEVVAGNFAAGLIIHEGQLTFESSGLHQVVDLGAWWSYEHRLPLPLGVNAVRSDLDAVHGKGTMREIATLLKQSVEYALAHREESVAYALRFARDMTSAMADEFIRLYVNKWTLDFGEVGKRAVQTFLRETHKAGLTPDAGDIEFVG